MLKYQHFCGSFNSHSVFLRGWRVLSFEPWIFLPFVTLLALHFK